MNKIIPAIAAITLLTAAGAYADVSASTNVSSTVETTTKIESPMKHGLHKTTTHKLNTHTEVKKTTK